MPHKLFDQKLRKRYKHHTVRFTGREPLTRNIETLNVNK